MTAVYVDDYPTSIDTTTTVATAIGSTSNVAISGGELVFTNSGTAASGIYATRAILRDHAAANLSLTDVEVEAQWDPGASIVAVFPAILLRTTNDWLTAANAYMPTAGYAFECQPSGSQNAIYQYVAGASSGSSTTGAKTYTGSLKFRQKVRCQGGTQMSKVWMSNAAEPSTWDLTASNASISGAGGVQVRNLTTTQLTVSLDWLVVRDLTWTERLGRRR